MILHFLLSEAGVRPDHYYYYDYEVAAMLTALICSLILTSSTSE